MNEDGLDTFELVGCDSAHRHEEVAEREPLAPHRVLAIREKDRDALAARQTRNVSMT